MDDRIHISIPFGLSPELADDLVETLKKHAPNRAVTIDIRDERMGRPDPWPFEMGKDQTDEN